MNKLLIDVGFKTVDQIFHLADIHIRNLKRHREYGQVFKRLEKEIKLRKIENSIIIVAGDIAHAKTEMSPELIKLISEFFNGLANICPTIVIPGNHDCNLNNKSRLDALSPIINNLNNSNLFYLKSSGIYSIANIDFTHMSVFDEPDDYIKSDSFESKNKFALFHGPVNNSVTDVGYVVNNREVKLDKFDGYDAVLMGDIHRHQTLQKLNKSKKLPIIVYPGSLIQQNHGETLKGHGMCVWDVPTRQFEFVEILNDYGYYTLDVDNGIVPRVDDMPKYPSLRIRIKNTEASQIKRIVTDIKKLYKVRDFTVIRNDRLSSNYNLKSKNSISDISDVNLQNKLIIDFLDRQGVNLDNIERTQIRRINRDINQRLSEDVIARNIYWIPKKFEYNNMFSYGETNIVDFTNIRGIVGIFAPNASGKSSVFDSLSFCLFDKTSRTSKALNILNDRKHQFSCKLNFEISGIDYFIERTAKKNKKEDHVKVNVNFYKIENGETVSLNGEERRDTNRIIREYVGSYDDFVLTALSLQNNNTLFIDKSQTERKDLLSKFMGIDIFDKLYTVAVDDIREKNAVLKNFRKNDFTSDLAKLETDLKLNYNKYSANKKAREILIKEKDKIDNKILKLTSQLYKIDDDNLDINKLNEEFKQLQNAMVSLESNIKTFTDNVVEIQNDISKIDRHLLASEFSYIEVNYQNLLTKDIELSNINHKIDLLKISVSNKLTKLKHLEQHEYDPDCNYCMNNVFVKDAIKTKEELNDDRKQAELLSENRKLVKQYIEDNNHIEINYKLYSDYLKSKQELKDNLTTAKTELNNYIVIKNETSVDLNNVKSNIDKFEKTKSQRLFNDKLEKQIQELLNRSDVIKPDISSSETEGLKYHGNISSLKNQKDVITKSIKEAKLLESEVSIYGHYISAIKRDGAPYEIISNTLPTIEIETNNILQQIVEFGIKLDTDGKNINANIVYEDRTWPLELTSGMERFISGLAIRVALTNISNLPRPNFLVIDEGLGQLDSDKLNSMYVLFQYLKNQFDYVIMISHIDQIRDMVDNFIEITKDVHGYSKINNS